MSVNTRLGIARFGWITLAIILIVSIALTPSADAHNGLMFTNPTAGSSVPTAPDHLELTFLGHLSDTGHQVDVRDTRGTELSLGVPRIQLESEVSTLIVPLPAAVPAGTYTVTVSALFLDGHTTLDSFLFVVTTGTSAGGWQQFQDEALVGLGIVLAGAGAVWWLRRSRHSRQRRRHQASPQQAATRPQPSSEISARNQRKQPRAQRAVRRS
jgi:methionine-rich copper-binding protein CopC